MYIPKKRHKPRGVVIVKAHELLKTLIDEKLSATAAAAKAGVSYSLIGRLIREDCPVNVSTAGRLQAAFGNHVIEYRGRMKNEGTEARN